MPVTLPNLSRCTLTMRRMNMTNTNLMKSFASIWELRDNESSKNFPGFKNEISSQDLRMQFLLLQTLDLIGFESLDSGIRSLL